MCPYVQGYYPNLKMRTNKYSEVTTKYKPINIPVYIFPRIPPSWKPQWTKPEPALCSIVPVDNVLLGLPTCWYLR